MLWYITMVMKNCWKHTCWKFETFSFLSILSPKKNKVAVCNFNQFPILLQKRKTFPFLNKTSPFSGAIALKEMLNFIKDSHIKLNDNQYLCYFTMYLKFTLILQLPIISRRSKNHPQQCTVYWSINTLPHFPKQKEQTQTDLTRSKSCIFNLFFLELFTRTGLSLTCHFISKFYIARVYKLKSILKVLQQNFTHLMMRL